MSPCKNGGTCHLLYENDDVTFRCDCEIGYFGSDWYFLFSAFQKIFDILVQPPTATLVEKMLSVLTVGPVTSRAHSIDFIIKMGPILKPMLSAHVSDLRIRFLVN